MKSSGLHLASGGFDDFGGFGDFAVEVGHPPLPCTQDEFIGAAREFLRAFEEDDSAIGSAKPRLDHDQVRNGWKALTLMHRALCETHWAPQGPPLSAQGRADDLAAPAHVFDASQAWSLMRQAQAKVEAFAAAATAVNASPPKPDASIPIRMEGLERADDAARGRAVRRRPIRT